MTASSLLPTRSEWDISRQFEAVAKPLYDITIKLQYLQCTPDMCWISITRLHRVYSDPKTFKVPAKVTESTELRTFELFEFDDLDYSIQTFITMVAEDLYDRIISLGPTKNQLICIYLNKGLSAQTLVEKGVLTATQVNGYFSNFRHSSRIVGHLRAHLLTRK